MLSLFIFNGNLVFYNIHTMLQNVKKSTRSFGSYVEIYRFSYSVFFYRMVMGRCVQSGRLLSCEASEKKHMSAPKETVCGFGGQ